MTTLQAFITAHGITAESTQVHPLKQDDWGKPDPGRKTYRVRLTRAGTELFSGDWTTVTFHMGSGLKGEPTADDVLSCLLMECQSIDDGRSFRPFAEWAEDLGYDTDSRRAYALWEKVGRQQVRIANWLGADNYAAFLECEEE